MLYEAIFVPEGHDPFPKEVMNSDTGYVFTSDDLSQGQVRRIVDIQNPVMETVAIGPASDSDFILGVLPIDGITIHSRCCSLSTVMP